jgi:hypothetical protein
MRDVVAGGTRVCCGWTIIVLQEFLDLLYHKMFILHCACTVALTIISALHCCQCEGEPWRSGKAVAL